MLIYSVHYCYTIYFDKFERHSINSALWLFFDYGSALWSIFFNLLDSAERTNLIFQCSSSKNFLQKDERHFCICTVVKQYWSRVYFIYTVYGVLNTNFGIYNSKIWAFYALLFLSFKTPIFSILVIKMPHFGVLCAKSVLWNFIKVKCHFWRLVFLKLTPGLNSKLIKLFNLSGKI